MHVNIKFLTSIRQSDCRERTRKGTRYGLQTISGAFAATSGFGLQTLRLMERDAWGNGRLDSSVRKATRRKFTHEEKIRIAPTMYYRRSKAFLEAGKNGLSRDTHRDATTEEVRRPNRFCFG